MDEQFKIGLKTKIIFMYTTDVEGTGVKIKCLAVSQFGGCLFRKLNLMTDASLGDSKARSTEDDKCVLPPPKPRSLHQEEPPPGGASPAQHFPGFIGFFKEEMAVASDVKT